MPQSVIGSLRVNLGLDSAQFEQGARRALSTTDGMQARFAGLARNITAMAAGLGAAVAGIGAITSSAAAVAREIENFSRSSNTSAEMFQKWAFGARSVGVEQEQLAGILKDVNDRIGDFVATGGGPMVDFFEQIAPKVGVTAEQFRNLSGPEALQLYVSSLEKAGANQQDMTFYLEALSSEATSLLPLLRNGGSEMVRLGERAEELGAVLSGPAMDALSDARTAAGEAAAAWSGLTRNLGAEAAPAFEAAARASANVAAALQPMVQHLDQVITVAGTAAVLFGARLAVSIGSTYVGAAITAIRQTIALEMALGATSRGAALASVSIKGLSVGLRVLKGALISTGIGAIVVGAGEAVYWFSRLVSATGGIGEALGLLWDVSKEVWTGIVTSAGAIPAGLRSVWNTVSAGFYSMVEGLQRGWLQFLVSLSNGLASIGADGASSAVSRFAEDVGVGLDQTMEKVQAFEAAAESASAEASAIGAQGLETIKTALGRLADAVSASEEATEDGTDAGKKYQGALGGVAGAAGKAATAIQKIKDEVKDLNLDADPVKKYSAGIAKLDKLLDHGLTRAAYDKGVAALNDELANSIPLVDDLTSGFSDFLKRGLTDFESFAEGIWGGFTGLLSDMITTAARNKIVLSMGLGATGTAGAATAGTIASSGTASAAGAGMLGGIGAGLGGFLSGVGSGASAALGLGSYASAGLFNVTANAAAASALTGASAFAATLGAVAAPLAIVAAAVSFFSKKTTELDKGIRVTTSGMDALVESFTKTKTTRFWGLSSSIDKTYKEASASISDPILAAVTSVGQGVAATAASLNLSADALADVSYQFKISTDGLSGDEIAAKLEKHLGKLGDKAAEAIFEGAGVALADLQVTGESALETLTRLSTHLGTVNATFDTLGHEMYAVGIAGADMASQLVQIFGSLDAFTEATSIYFTAFYGEAERLDILTRQTTEALGALGYALPETREQFRSMVEGLDLTTETGREAYAALVGLSGALDQILPAIADFASVVSGLVGTTSSAVGAMIADASSMAQSAAQAASDWLGASETLRDFIRDLNGATNSALTPQQQLAALTRDLTAAFDAAKGGDLEAARGFGALAGDYLGAARAQASSALEYRRIESSVKAQANLLAGISELEGASQTAIESLAQEQVDVLNELNTYLQSSDSLTPEDLASFETRLSDLQAAIEAAEMFSYDYLKERLQVSVDLLPNADIPPDVKALIAAAASGIDSTIEFAVRAADLTPDLRWLAITQTSEHLKTIDFVVGEDLDNRTRRLALDDIATLTRTVNLVMGSGLEHDEMAVALAGNSELARVVNVSLSSGADQQAIRLALANAGSYSVAVRAALTASAEVREIVFGNAGSYAAMIEAAFSPSMTEDQRRILLQKQGTYAVTVSAVLAANTGDAMRTLLLRASTQAVRAVTVAMAFASTVTDAERQLLLTQSANIQRTITAMVNPYGITTFDQLFLDQLANGGDRALGITGWIETRGISGLGQSFLQRLGEGDASTLREIVADVEMGRVNGLAAAYLDQLRIGAGNTWRTIAAGVGLGQVGTLGQQYLRQLNAGAGSITRILDGEVDLSGLNAAQLSLLEAVRGGSVGTLRLGGSFTFDPSAAFANWYAGTTRSEIASPMATLGAALNNLRAALIEHQAELAAQTAALAAQTAAADKQEKVSALESYVAKLPGDGQGTFTANATQLMEMADILGVSKAGSVYDVAAKISGFSATDAVRAIAPNDTALWNYLKSYLGNTALQVNDEAYLASRPDVARSSVYGNDPQQHWEDYGRAEIQRDPSWFRPALFDWSSIGISIPGYASGTNFHPGGLAMVGEQGAELVDLPRGSKVYPSPMTDRLLARDAEVAELRRLRAEIADMKDSMTQLGLKQGRDIAKLRRLAEKDDTIGLPPERASA
ncbi:hypothetical protein PVT71_14530 [Salipiger sp. H15]|uniref:Bacteriophage tail tape measure N-terminal domain-containing protein n=1 Tax=Alloyangia sp. H15 TaxID=3029062 RepID=A0AAU8APA3_9RHOB